MLRRSAPTKPAVAPAISPRLTSGARRRLRVWILRIASRPARSGGETVTRRSNRPGRSSAGSRTSGRFVAASTTTFWFGVKPSISVRIWLSVCSRSSLAPKVVDEARERPMASSSSMKMMLGAASLALAKRSRTRDAPTPTMASTNSEAERLKNGRLASPATARARSVLPVPGGPTRRMPCGICAPSRWYFSGVLRKSTTWARSCLASSIPATSAKVVFGPESGV